MKEIIHIHQALDPDNGSFRLRCPEYDAEGVGFTLENAYANLGLLMTLSVAMEEKSAKLKKEVVEIDKDLDEALE